MIKMYGEGYDPTENGGALHPGEGKCFLHDPQLRNGVVELSQNITSRI